MKAIKKGAVLLLAAVLCIGSSARTTKAAGCSHPRLGDKPGTDEVIGTYNHKVMRNIYVGSQQVYSLCYVERHAIYSIKQCFVCYYQQKTEKSGYEIHTLEDDPDHVYG